MAFKRLFIIGVVFFLLETSCEDTLNGLRRKSAPTVETTAVTKINPHWAYAGGIIKHDGNLNVQLEGLCWDTIVSPTFSTEKCNYNLADSVNFGFYMYGLKEETTYYIRAYASNSEGGSYGQTRSFTTPKHICNLDINTMEYDTVLHNFAPVTCGFDPLGGPYKILAKSNVGNLTLTFFPAPAPGLYTIVLNNPGEARVLIDYELFVPATIFRAQPGKSIIVFKDGNGELNVQFCSVLFEYGIKTFYGHAKLLCD
ncbi:MAG: hypothetical protein IIA45_15655 [Bacteroidetes bacterium]|nr:hypothetical protein [Bacteroidota bacterium]